MTGRRADIEDDVRIETSHAFVRPLNLEHTRKGGGWVRSVMGWGRGDDKRRTACGGSVTEKMLLKKKKKKNTNSRGIVVSIYYEYIHIHTCMSMRYRIDTRTRT